MSINAPTFYGQQYASTIQLLLQQKGSKLRPFVMTGSHKGKAASPVDQIGSISMQTVVGRFNPMGRVDATLDRRWVFPIHRDLPQLLDSFDMLEMLVDPKGKYVENAVYAAGRAMDDTVIDALFGTAYTGVEHGTSTTFPAGNIVAVNQGASGNVNLSVAKLRQAKKLLMSYEVDVDNDPLTCVVTASQHDALLAETQVISLDFNEKPVMMEGKITRFLGINFIHCERLDNNATPYRMVPVFAKSGMYLGLWDDINVNVSQRNDLQGEPWQAYVKLSCGATRLEENKVIQILCNEA